MEISGGNLLIDMRNYWERDGKQPEKGRMRAVARSSDGGQTWSELEFHPDLIEPVCQASLIRQPNSSRSSSLMLFSNPADREKRIRMTVRISDDEGRTWLRKRVIHEGPSAYSCMALLPNGELGILYERGETSAYECIAFTRLTIADARAASRFRKRPAPGIDPIALPRNQPRGPSEQRETIRRELALPGGSFQRFRLRASTRTSATMEKATLSDWRG